LVHGGQGKLQETEKIFLVASVVYYRLHLCGGAFAAQLARCAAGDGSVAAEIGLERQRPYMYMAIGVVGTTIAPWMQFYLQIFDRGEGAFA